MINYSTERLSYTAYFVFNWVRNAFNILMGKIGFKIRVKPFIDLKAALTIDETHSRIKEIILSGKPAMIARFGGNEARCTAEAIGIELGARKKFRPKTLRYMHINAGLFPAGEEMSMRFAQICKEAAQEVDLLGYWGSFMQDYLINHICPAEMELTFLEDLEAYNSSSPWTAALEGKKVLVIHPFKASIEAQYKRREHLFQNPNVLPEFELKVLKAVQTIAGEEDGRFADWEEALLYMYEEAIKIDFDVAIIGCGAYGMPLAAKLKKAGKIAIHLGGATQLMFGIKGARWDNHKTSRFYNSYWVRPLPEETPQKSKLIESACYW